MLKALWRRSIACIRSIKLFRLGHGTFQLIYIFLLKSLLRSELVFTYFSIFNTSNFAEIYNLVINS